MNNIIYSDNEHIANAIKRILKYVFEMNGIKIIISSDNDGYKKLLEVLFQKKKIDLFVCIMCSDNNVWRVFRHIKANKKFIILLYYKDINIVNTFEDFCIGEQSIDKLIKRLDNLLKNNIKIKEELYIEMEDDNEFLREKKKLYYHYSDEIFK